MKTIAIIDDDTYIVNMLKELLIREGYNVICAYSGTEGLMLLEHRRPDLILLDLMLPGMNGEEVLPQIKGIPVIIESAKIDVPDKVNLLLSGAVDYITKPFDTKELLARITVHLRTASSSHGSLLSWNEITLNCESHEVTVQDLPIRLTKTEYAILKMLLQNPSQVMTKSSLLDQISLDTPDCMESSLKVHISNLRKKLKDKTGKDYIEAVWGIGFKLREE